MFSLPRISIYNLKFIKFKELCKAKILKVDKFLNF